METVWHEGETYLHRALGIEEKMRERGAKFVREAMPDQHRIFFANQRFVILGGLKSDGKPWAFLRAGEPGFMASPDPKHLTIRSVPLPGEPEGLQLKRGDKISVLGIEFETRRRNRMNGTIVEQSGETIHIAVDQSYGNCPRYIHTRQQIDKEEQEVRVDQSKALSPNDIQEVRSADMFFIASRAPKTSEDRRAGVDVNHRGGQPGFIKALEGGVLTFPDYHGNNFFNTFGNIILDQRVCLMVPNFTTGNILTIEGSAELVTLSDADAEAQGVARTIDITPSQRIRAEGALPLRYALEDLSRDRPLAIF